MKTPITELYTILDDFALLGSWTLRFSYIVDLGKEAPILPHDFCTNDYIIHGCSSPLWYKLSWDNFDQIVVQLASPSQIPKGLAGLAARIFNGSSASDCRDFWLENSPQTLLQKLELTTNLSPTRVRTLETIFIKTRDFCS